MFSNNIKTFYSLHWMSNHTHKHLRLYKVTFVILVYITNVNVLGLVLYATNVDALLWVDFCTSVLSVFIPITVCMQMFPTRV